MQLNRYFDIDTIGRGKNRIEMMYDLKTYKMPQFLNWLLVLNKTQYALYHKYVCLSAPLNYDYYLQLLSVFLPVDGLINRGVINPYHRDFYNEIHEEFAVLNFGYERANKTLFIDPDKVLSLYVKIEKPVKIWEDSPLSERTVPVRVNHDIDDAENPMNIEYYFFG